MVTKDEFLDALRSGDYRQGTAGLSKNGKYCCMGVYCDLAAPDRWRALDYATETLSSSFAGGSNALDERYAIRMFGDMLGLSPDTPFEILFKVQVNLIHRNDGVGDFEGDPHSFERIAQWIEDDLEDFVEDLIGDLRFTRWNDMDVATQTDAERLATHA